MTAADAGRTLRDLREAAGVTIADLAEATSYTPGWLRSLEERGVRTRASTLTIIGEALARLRDFDDEQTGQLVAVLLAAADGDHKPEAPPGTPSRRRDPARHRRQVADERRRDRRRELQDLIDAADPDELLAWVRDAVTPPSPWSDAADLLEDQNEGDDGDR